MNPDTSTRGKAGRKPALKAQHIEILREIVGEQPHASLDEVIRVLQGRTGKVVCAATVRTALRQAGISHSSPCARSANGPLRQAANRCASAIPMLTVGRMGPAA